MRRCRWEVRGILALAVVPVVAVSSTARAQTSDSDEPIIGLASLRDVQVRSVAPRPITALPLQSPPVNGFQPFVVFGLTDEYSTQQLDAIVVGSEMPGGNVVPNPARYFIGTLDSGSSAHIVGYEAAQLINLDAHGLYGPNTVLLSGAGGTGTQEAFVSDALGFYVTSLGNATSSPNGPVVSPTVMKGMYNAPILTIEEPSIIPNIVGAPTFADHQIAILNSQTKRLAVNGQTYQGPHVELRSFGTPVSGDFTRITLEMAGPPDPLSGGPTSPAQPATFFPDFTSTSDWWDDPWAPAQWNSMYPEVDLTRGANAANDKRLLLDTGAQVSVISKDVANSLGISTNPGSETPADFTVEVLGIGGIEIVPGYFIDSLSMRTDLGTDMVWTDVPVLVINLPNPRGGGGFVPGIVGMNLFNDRDMVINGNLDDPFFAISKIPITPMWTATAGGNWGNVANWTLGVPDVPEKLANFTSATPAPQTITVEADYILGNIKFDNAGAYTINGPGRLTFETLGRPALVEVVSGSHAINAPLTFLNDATFKVTPAASTLTLSNDVIATGADLFKSGAGNLAMKNVRAGSLAVNEGKVTILPNGSSSGVSNVGGLSIAAGAKLDLTDNDLVVRGGALGAWESGSSAYTGLTGLIDAGRGNAGSAQWDGTTGIVTSDTRAVGSNFTSLGIATGAQVKALTGTDTATWNGQTVSADDVLVMFTYGGDANLDGKINIDDYGRIDGNVASSGSVFGWFNGDFNYDGKINIDDYGVIDGNINAQGAPLSSSAALEGLAAVPEPGTLALLASAGLLPLRRRRRTRCG